MIPPDCLLSILNKRLYILLNKWQENSGQAQEDQEANAIGNRRYQNGWSQGRVLAGEFQNKWGQCAYYAGNQHISQQGKTQNQSEVWVSLPESNTNSYDEPDHSTQEHTN